MPILVQVSIVAVAIAIVALAVVAIRAIQRMDKATDEIVGTVRTISNTLSEVKPAVDDARQAIAKFGAIAPHLESVAKRFETLGHQVADVSETVVHEIETPLRTAAAVVRGVRTGTNHLVGRWVHGRASTNARGGSYDG